MHTHKSVFFLALPRRCILTKEERRGRFYAHGSHEQQLSVWQRKIKGCVKVLFVLDFFSIYDCVFFLCRTASISPCAQRRHSPDVSG